MFFFLVSPPKKNEEGRVGERGGGDPMDHPPEQVASPSPQCWFRDTSHEGRVRVTKVESESRVASHTSLVEITPL